MSIIYDALNKVEDQGRDLAPVSGAESGLPETGKAAVTSGKAASGRVSEAACSRFSIQHILAIILVGSFALYILNASSIIPVSSGPVTNPRAVGPFSAPVSSSTADAAQALANTMRPVAIGAGVDKPTYVLQGVIYGDEAPLALINGKKVSLGEAIAGARVVTISSDGVELANGNTTIFLPLE
jgi:hypothetical protein